MIKQIERRFRGGQKCDTLIFRVDLEKALVRFMSHLVWKDVQLLGHHVGSLTICSTGMDTTDTTIFEGSVMEMAHLHQLAHIVFGLETSIPGHRVFRDHDLVNRIDEMRGPLQDKAKAILACMAKVSDDVARTLIARDYKHEEVCMAYALHVSDPSVSMLELLRWQYAEA